MNDTVMIPIPFVHADAFEQWMELRTDGSVDDRTTFLNFVFPTDAGAIAFKMKWEDVIENEAEYGLTLRGLSAEFSSIDLEIEEEIVEWVESHIPGFVLTVTTIFRVELSGSEHRFRSDVRRAFP